MSEWGEGERESAPVDWDTVKRNALIGAVCAAVVIAWMFFARPGEELASSRGFNMGGDGGGGGSGKLFAQRSQTGLDMVSSKIGAAPANLTPNSLLGGPTSDSAASISPAAAASQSVASSPTPPAATIPTSVPASMADEAKTLSKAGVATDPGSLNTLGAKEGMLSSLAAKMLNHPAVLAAVFNNKKVVDAFMSRPRVRENCQSGDALKTYLSDPNSGGMTKVFPVIQQALGNAANSAALVGALAGTEMTKRLSECPSLKAVSNDSSAITSIAMANPKALSLLMDPRGMAALASNPQAAGALAGLQSKMGGAK